MKRNYLKMNDSKTEALEVYSPYTRFTPLSTLNFENCIIELSESAKNLGFWFDSSLNLDTQISYVAKVCYLNLRNISRIGSKLYKDLKIQLVHGCIHSIIDYCNATYFGLSKFQLDKLQRIQNSAVRFIFGLKGKERFQNITPFLKELHFLPVKFRIQFKIALLTFKCLNNMAPEYLKDMIFINESKQKSLRVDDDFFLLKQPAEPRFSHSRGSFHYSAPRIWNRLPYTIRTMSSLDAFKKALKTNLFRRAFRNDGGLYEFNVNMMLFES